MKTLLLVALLLTTALVGPADAGYLTWPGYDKWSTTDYGCWLPTDPSGQWHTVITGPTTNGTPVWDWNIVQMRANNGSWVATFVFHWKECLWAYAPDLPGYWQVQPSLPGMPGPGWLYGLTVNHASADGAWVVASTQDGTRSFRWSPVLGKLREIGPVSTPGLVTATAPFEALPPGHTVTAWVDNETAMVVTPQGDEYSWHPYDGQAFFPAQYREGHAAFAVPFNPAFGSAADQAKAAGQTIIVYMERMIDSLDLLGGTIWQIQHGWPSWLWDAPGLQNAMRQDAMKKHLNDALGRAEIIDLQIALLEGIVAHDPAQSQILQVAKLARREANHILILMYRAIRRTEPIPAYDIPQNIRDAMVSATGSPLAPTPPPVSPTSPPPVVSPEQRERSLAALNAQLDYFRRTQMNAYYLRTVVSPEASQVPYIGDAAMTTALQDTVDTGGLTRADLEAIIRTPSEQALVQQLEFRNP